jgi:hypothetical protein
MLIATVFMIIPLTGKYPSVIIPSNYLIKASRHSLIKHVIENFSNGTGAYYND